MRSLWKQQKLLVCTKSKFEKQLNANIRNLKSTDPGKYFPDTSHKIPCFSAHITCDWRQL